MISGIILAAGESNRMGVAKQLLTIAGEPLLCRVIRQVKGSNFDQVKVVIGAYASQLEPLLKKMDVEIVYNPDFHKGQSSSVKAGLKDSLEGYEGAAFILGDQPLTQIETYNHLIQVFKDKKPGILLPSYQGRKGNPIFFHQRFFLKLMQVEGDRGGREIIKAQADQVLRVEVDDPGVVFDLDYPEDYQSLCKQLSCSKERKGEAG